MKKIRYMILAAAMAATAAQAADSILWDINAASGGTDSTSPWDFIDAGVTEDITSGTVEVVAGSNDLMTNAVGDLSLDNVDNNGGTYDWGAAAGPIMADGANGRNIPDSPMQIAGLTNYLSPSTAYKFYVWAHGDGANQNATIIFDGEAKATTSQLEPASNSPDNFVVVFNFTTGAAVSNTLDFTWSHANKYTGLNGFAIVEDDGSTPPVVDLPPNAPSAMYTVISNMAVEVKFTGSTVGTEPITYNVMRSLESGTNYVAIGTTTDTVYVDTTVESNATYYYVVNAMNAFGETEYTDEATGAGLPYDIIGTDSSYGAGGLLDKDNLFDNDIATFFDTTTSGAYAGLDFGEDNAQQIVSIAYTLRGQNGGVWAPAVGLASGATFEGADNPEFNDSVVLATIPGTVSPWPAVNTAVLTNTDSYRYIRLIKGPSEGLYFMAELDFITEDQVTAEGTWFEWLDYYYDVSGDNPSNFADYAEADYSDTDGDGLQAYQEYQLNGDPTDANSPAGTANLYVWPEAPLENVVRWDESATADVDTGGGYIVYRSLMDTNYMAVAMVTTNVYNDTDVVAGETYYYKVSVTNASAQHETTLSASGYSVANEYQIFGVMNNTGAQIARWFYMLFDRDRSTFLDDNAAGGYAGLDYGVGNGKVIAEVYFNLRNDANWGAGYDGDVIVIDGVTNEVTRAQYFSYGNTFEGSNDTNGNWTVLATITNMIPMQGLWNAVTVADATAYQYVRYNASNGNNNYAMADVEFLTADDFTAKGTPILWLEEYDLTVGDDEVDVDSDGHESWQEFLAYTDPNDSNSVLKVTSFSYTNGLEVTWQSIEGIRYGIYSTENLVHETPVAEATVTGLDGETSYTGTVSGAGTVFYEIGVE